MTKKTTKKPASGKPAASSKKTTQAPVKKAPAKSLQASRKGVTTSAKPAQGRVEGYLAIDSKGNGKIFATKQEAQEYAKKHK